MTSTTTAPATLPMNHDKPKLKMFPLFDLKPPTVNICMRTGAQTRQLVDTRNFAPETVAVAEAENFDPEKLIEFVLKDGSKFCNLNKKKIKNNRWNLSFDFWKTNYNGVLEEIPISVGHLAFVPRRPVSSDGVQQFDTRVVLSEYCKPCCSITPVKEYKCVIERTVPSPDWELLYDFGNSGNLPTANSKQMWAKCVLEKARYSMGGANNVAVFVKLWLLHALVSRYSDFDNLENYEYVIDEDNRPFFGTWTAKSIPENAIAEEPDWWSHSNCSHVFAEKSMSVFLAHCLYLAILPWPVWTGPANVVVPPELAVLISGDKGTDICFITNTITKESFGNVIKMPEAYQVRYAIWALADMEFAHEEACRAREIAARLTFYWPSHCKPEQQREIKNVDAANLSTFLNNNLTLPKPHCSRSFISKVFKSESSLPPWCERLDQLFRLHDINSVVYDNLLGRSLLYAQDSVAQSLCYSADFMLSSDNEKDDATPFLKCKTHVINLCRSFSWEKPTQFQSRCYTVGNSIFGFMPSLDSLRWCYESNDWSRAVYSSLRLPNRLVLRQMSSAQVFDIMKVVPDTCFIAAGSVSISNLNTCLSCTSDSDITPWFNNCYSVRNNQYENSAVVNDNTIGVRLGTFLRCYSPDSSTSALNVYCSYQSRFNESFSQKLLDAVICDPVFANLPEEATWTSINIHTNCNHFFNVVRNDHHDQVIRWMAFTVRGLTLKPDESYIPFGGIIDNFRFCFEQALQIRSTFTNSMTLFAESRKRIRFI